MTAEEFARLCQLMNESPHRLALFDASNTPQWLQGHTKGFLDARTRYMLASCIFAQGRVNGFYLTFQFASSKDEAYNVSMRLEVGGEWEFVPKPEFLRGFDAPFFIYKPHNYKSGPREIKRPIPNELFFNDVDVINAARTIAAHGRHITFHATARDWPLCPTCSGSGVGTRVASTHPRPSEATRH